MSSPIIPATMMIDQLQFEGLETEIKRLDGALNTAKGDVTRLEGDLKTANANLATAKGDVTRLQNEVTAAENATLAIQNASAEHTTKYAAFVDCVEALIAGTSYDTANCPDMVDLLTRLNAKMAPAKKPGEILKGAFTGQIFSDLSPSDKDTFLTEVYKSERPSYTGTFSADRTTTNAVLFAAYESIANNALVLKGWIVPLTK